MRMRKKPWAKDMIEKRTDCVINDPEKMNGKWSKLTDGKVVVEIGSGKGDYWIAMAHQYPDDLWIAVEKNIDAAAIALKKSLDNTSKNMKMIINDAQNIDKWFAQGEVDRIHLNFSDPWPKKSHTKRRLTYDSFLKAYEHVLKKDGSIVMKTDNAKLFEYSLASFSQAGWLLKEVSVDFRRDEHPEDAITEYESNFMALNQPIYRVIFEKRTDEKDE
ncbi:MAG: tRNA (guanosine(46)-N7)-methyltransferase TrmB [Erysipelotrichia bacterium]|nr:tRNA (guanosine(46)-N7)-methyltransferase TrmB [Erysipelotrichia bacterium]